MPFGSVLGGQVNVLIDRILWGQVISRFIFTSFITIYREHDKRPKKSCRYHIEFFKNHPKIIKSIFYLAK
jgi:hypothetical protein